jgi:hypothetical protein
LLPVVAVVALEEAAAVVALFITLVTLLFLHQPMLTL